MSIDDHGGLCNRRQFVASVTTVLAGGSLVQLGAQEATTAPAARPTKRVFVAEFSHETNTFHPQKTDSYSYSEIDPSFSHPGWRDAGLTTVSGPIARPNSGGTISASACREAMGRVLDSLRAAGRVDGVFLRLHGAMYAEGIGPAESVLVKEIRNIVGPAAPIACTFDLHGNIPAWLADSGNILVGLKTAPHTDVAETARLAGRILLETLGGRLCPVSYILPIPMILQGEKAMTTAEPFRSLVEEARRLEREGIQGHTERILAATLFVGCAWTDSADTGMSVVVTADRSRPAARAAAIHLAQQIWDARHQFAFGCESADLEKAISTALEAKEASVFLTDSGDNVTAGTPGDMPLVLRALVERKVKNAVVAGINDKQAVTRCIEAGEGKTLKLSIGANIEKRFGPPMETEAHIIRLITGDQPQAVVRIGELETILTAGPAAFNLQRHFESCGIDPLSRRIVVIKQGYLFPELRRVAPRHIMLLTPGAGDMRIEQLTYIRRRKPVFPFEKDATFSPATAPV